MLTTYCFFLDVQKVMIQYIYGGNGCRKIRGKLRWENRCGEWWNYDEKSEKCGDADGKISDYTLLNFYEELHKDIDYTITEYIQDIYSWDNCSRRSKKSRWLENTVSGFMFVDDFVRISETLDGLQKQIVEKAPESTRKSRVTANVKNSAVVVCYEDMVNAANFEWRWGDDEFPIVGQ